MTKRKGLIISLIVWIAASLMLLYLFFVPVDEEYPCETESHPTTIEMIIYSFAIIYYYNLNKLGI